MTQAAATRSYPGVAARPRPCWVLINPDTGRAYADDRLVSHFDTECDAQEYSDPSLQARQLGTPCFIVTPSCGEQFEADGTALCFPTLAAAIESLTTADWQVVDGRLCCEDCGQACGQ